MFEEGKKNVIADALSRMKSKNKGDDKEVTTNNNEDDASDSILTDVKDEIDESNKTNVIMNREKKKYWIL